MSDAWKAEIEGPSGLLLRYDIHLLTEVGDTGLWMRSTSEFGGPYAITRKGAERKARRLLARERRRDFRAANRQKVTE